jgi:hypothetical protein
MIIFSKKCTISQARIGHSGQDWVGWWVGLAQIIDDMTYQRGQTKTYCTETTFFLNLAGHEVNKCHVYDINYLLISTILYWWKRLN